MNISQNNNIKNNHHDNKSFLDIDNNEVQQIKNFEKASYGNYSHRQSR